MTLAVLPIQRVVILHFTTLDWWGEVEARFRSDVDTTM